MPRARARSRRRLQASRRRSTWPALWGLYALDRPDLKDAAVDARHASRACSPPDGGRLDLFAVMRRATCWCTTPTTRSHTSVAAFIDQAAARPGRAGDQADAVPDVGPRQPDRAVAHPSRRARASRWWRSSSSRRASTRRPTSTGRGRWRRRASTSCTGWSGLKTHAKVVPGRAPGGRRHPPLRARRHRQLQPDDGATIYEDVGLLTADRDLGADVATCSTSSPATAARATYRKLLVAPLALRAQADRADRARGAPARAAASSSR